MIGWLHSPQAKCKCMTHLVKRPLIQSQMAVRGSSVDFTYAAVSQKVLFQIRRVSLG